MPEPMTSAAPPATVGVTHPVARAVAEGVVWVVPGAITPQGVPRTAIAPRVIADVSVTETGVIPGIPAAPRAEGIPRIVEADVRAPVGVGRTLFRNACLRLRAA